MKTKILALAFYLYAISSTVLAVNWPVYYQPTVGSTTPTPTPLAYAAMLTGGYCDFRAQSDYDFFHTGIDFGVSVPPGTPPPTPLTAYVVYPVLPGIVKDIDYPETYKSRINIQSGNLIYSYGHLVVDQSLTEDVPVSIATPLGRIFHTGGVPIPHLHLAVFDSTDLDASIQNLQDQFDSGLVINSNPEVVFRKDPTPSPDKYSEITFFSNDSAGSINHLYKMVSGQVDILAQVHCYAQGSSDPAGVQSIGYRIYQGLLPTTSISKEPVHEAVLINSKTFNGSVNGMDYRPCDYDKYPTPLPSIDADVIFARDDDYKVYVDSVLRDYRTDDDPYSGLRFVYIVTNNTDATPTRGNPEYLSKNGCWDTTELRPDGCRNILQVFTQWSLMRAIILERIELQMLNQTLQFGSIRPRKV